MLLHATCVAIRNQGVLLTGDPGSGKSDLALRLIDAGAELVSDDMTKLYIEAEQLFASAPPTIAGLLEVRHVGILKLPFCAAVPVALYVEIVSSGEVLDRLPDRPPFKLLDMPIPHLKLPAREASTPAKIRAALSFPPATEGS